MNCDGCDDPTLALVFYEDFTLCTDCASEYEAGVLDMRHVSTYTNELGA